MTRRVRPATYLVFFALFTLAVVAAHGPLLGLPYWWDEIGFYAPATWDLYERSALIPVSTTPNAHPPGVRLLVACVWALAGPSVEAARLTMLALAAGTLLVTFMLAIELCKRAPGAPAFGAVLLLLVSPVFFMQSMMLQPEVPAALALGAALLAFLRNAPAASVAACVALVMIKETGVVVPLVLGAFAWRDGQRRQAAWFGLPVAALAVWFGWLWSTTGHVFGDAEFGHYNAIYNLHPARLLIALARRAYSLFFENFHWLGAIALWNGLAKGLFRERSWRVVAAVGGAHVLLISATGGAVLERYLVPVLPLLYCGVVAGQSLFTPRTRWLHQALLAGGLLLGLWWNPPYPFPLENNLAMRDQVMLFQQASALVESMRGDPVVATAWPLSAALKDPRQGYVARPRVVREVPDFRSDTLTRRDLRPFDVFILFTREWDPETSPLRWAPVRSAWQWIYGYRPQVTTEECSLWLGVPVAATFERRGLRVDIFRLPNRVQ